MNTIERIKHGVENRIKEITILMLVAIVISASWLINSLLYPDKPVLQNPALPIISIIICFAIWIYLFKTEWFKNFKKYITIGQHELNFMGAIKLIIRGIFYVLLIIMVKLYFSLIEGPLLRDLFPTHYVLIKILMMGIAVIVGGGFMFWVIYHLRKDNII